MPTFSELLPATATHEHNGIRWTPEPDRRGCGLLRIFTGKTVVAYAVTEFATPWDGRGFRLVKDGAGTDPESDGYDVFVHRGGQNHSCSCKGFTYGRGRPCKHIEAALALLANGWV